MSRESIHEEEEEEVLFSLGSHNYHKLFFQTVCLYFSSFSPNFSSAVEHINLVVILEVVVIHKAAQLHLLRVKLKDDALGGHFPLPGKGLQQGAKALEAVRPQGDLLPLAVVAKVQREKVWIRGFSV